MVEKEVDNLKRDTERSVTRYEVMERIQVLENEFKNKFDERPTKGTLNKLFTAQE